MVRSGDGGGGGGVEDKGGGAAGGGGVSVQNTCPLISRTLKER